MKKITMEEIMDKNPNINPNKLKESMDLSDELRSHGISRRGYGLVPTFSGKKAKAVDSKEDKRAMHLTRS
jgi:hypothetical protein